MNRGVLAFTAVVALWALPALADPTIPADVFVSTQGENQILAKDILLNAKVQNADGQIIGDIEDFILNSDNQIVGVIMGVGGFAGFGEKRIGVNLSALQIKHDNNVVTVALPQATKEVLDALPAFERKQPPKSLMDRAIEKAKELTDKGSVTAKDAYEKAKEEAGPAYEKAKEAAKDAYDKAREAVETPAATEPPAATETPAATEAPAAPATEAAPSTPPADAAPATPPAETPAAPPAETPPAAPPAP